MGTEAAQTEAYSYTRASDVSDSVANTLLESPVAAQEGPFSTQSFSSQPAFPANKWSGACNKAAHEYIMPPGNNGSDAAQFSSPPQGVSNCYIFKSRLQEYAQKKTLPTPVYETIKEGPSHEPYFRSTVIVNDVRYDSLPGFCNRKAAEQSAAEVALTELAKFDEVECISLPVHETGLCKNLLQEYAQKMNFAIPLYQCQKIETPGRARAPNFKCTVDIGGIHYIGGPANTKREAEIKAARTALLAIQLSSSESSRSGNSQLTVLPFRKRVAETAPTLDKSGSVPKAKKPRFKKKMPKNKFPKHKMNNNNNNNQIKLPGNGLLPLPSVESLKGESLVSEICGIETANDAVSNSTVDQNAANASESRLTTGDQNAASESKLTTGDQNAANASESRLTTGDQNAANASENLSTTVDCNQSIDGMLTQMLSESNEDAAKMSGVAPTEARPSTVITG